MNQFHIVISVKSSPTQFTPSNIFQPLPSEVPKPTSRKNAIHNASGKDYRLGPLRVDWVDFDNMSKPLKGNQPQASPGPATAVFVQTQHTKTGSTNLAQGVVHLLRESLSSDTAQELATDQVMTSGDGSILGVLAVPSWMTPSDFLAFVAPAAEGMAHLRMVRDTAPNRSMVIIKFRRREDAQEFTEVYNGKMFNSMESESCHVVQVASVSIEPDDNVGRAISRLASVSSSSYELPTCPVCLERMDSAVTGLVTVPCSHTFHCACLSKWGDSRCPVCRYSQTLLSSHPSSSTSTRTIPFAPASNREITTCADCASATNLWICLICGNVGCGRYGRAHAHAHYQHTTHLYALELETQRVWDYAGDGYVHRLIQNKADGKLVELPSAAMASTSGSAEDQSGQGPRRTDALTAEKIEAIGIEYSYLLTSQLDSQRSYYEEQTLSLRAKMEEMERRMEALVMQAEVQREAAQLEQLQRRQEDDERQVNAMRERERLEKKTDRLAELARKLEKDLREERAVSAGLLRNLNAAREQIETASNDKDSQLARVAELEDQVRDLMFFLETKDKIDQGGEVGAELAGGSVELPPARTTPSSSSNKKKKRK